MTYTITPNEAFKSIEITFNEKPAENIRAALKELGFRWHKMRGLWYGYKDAETVRNALEAAGIDKDIAEAKQELSKAVTKTNYFGVKVGDIFCSSWGYEQTNVDFFQVIALVGEKSVRVREVHLPMMEETPTCSMTADRKYKVVRDLLPPSPYSVHIKDQEKGDLKVLKSYDKDGKSHPQFKVASYADAYLMEGDTTTVYESWYY